MFSALKTRKWPELVTAFFLVVGVLLRLRQFSCGRSMGLDEARLALHIINASFQTLFLPFDNSFAPPGFLFLEKSVGVWFGYGENVLRLVPLLSGIGALFLFYRVALLLISRRAIPLAVAFFALCPMMIDYASVLKQYSTDVLVSLMALLLVRRMQDGAWTRSRAYVYGFCGALMIWCSVTAVFILSGSMIIECVHGVVRKERDRAASLIVIGSVWILAGVWLWSLCLRAHPNQDHFIDFWREYFIPEIGRISWFARTLQDFFSRVVGLGWMWIGGAVAFLSGCVGLAITCSRRLAHLLAPLLLLLAAAALDYYPLTGRYLLFILPVVLMVMAEGVFFFQGRGWGRLAGVMVAAALLVVPVGQSAALMKAPIRKEEIKGAIQYWKTNRLPEDNIYLYFWSVPAFQYYEPEEFRSERCLVGGWFKDIPDRAFLRSDLARFPGKKRVWVLFSHSSKSEEAAFLKELNLMGKQLRAFKTQGASVYLYDFP
ncbi:MAG: hypothetical protein WCO69_06095 [Candidatus Omnitrophota bacterium]